MSRAWRVVAGLLAVALTVYFLVFAFKSVDIDDVHSAVSSAPVFLALIAAAILYACVIPITGWAWSVLLSSRGEVWRPLVLTAILGLAQLAKYVPGNVAQHAARAAIATRRGMTPVSLVATVAQETVLAIAASLFVGVLALLAAGQGLAHIGPQHAKIILIAGGAMLVLVAVFSLTKGGADGGEAKPWRKLLSALTHLPGRKATIAALSAYSVNYLLIGVGFWLLARALGDPGGLSYFMVTAAFSLSWLLGFMTPGAPAGLGAREGIMLMLLQGAAPVETAVTYVLLARIVTLLGDGICFVGGALLHVKLMRAERSNG
jgi:uncharacterized membrane protein YbhN (UPF0104 family)